MPQPGVEYWLNVSFKLKQETAWAPLGHEIAWDQFALPASRPRPSRSSRTAALDVKDGDDDADLHRQGLLRALRQAGRRAHASYRYQGVTLLERGPRPDFWRAPTNNDRGAWKVFRQRGGTEQEPSISSCGARRGRAGT